MAQVLWGLLRWVVTYRSFDSIINSVLLILLCTYFFLVDLYGGKHVTVRCILYE
jgi:hypothetical protein